MAAIKDPNGLDLLHGLLASGARVDVIYKVQASFNRELRILFLFFCLYINCLRLGHIQFIRRYAQKMLIKCY